MQLLIIRHAIALPRGTPGIPDPERPLTERGIEKFRKAAAGLARLSPPPEAILTSPWTRARHTAEIASEAWGGPVPLNTPCLAGGSFDLIQKELAAFPESATVAIVGHEPDLSALLAILLGTDRGERVAFKKGGAALVDLNGGLLSGGRLIWFLPPKILRRLAER